jgi:hypothetical protein
MAYIANQQRKTYNNNLVRGDFATTVATFQINKYNRGGGQNPYSLFKIQANWASGSKVVNSELYVNQFILDDSGTSIFNYLPEGTSGAIFIYPISGSINYSKYSHLLHSDDTNLTNYFSISFDNIVSDPGDSDYYLIDVIVNTPNYANGNLIADSYCYILNTI